LEKKSGQTTSTPTVTDKRFTFPGLFLTVQRDVLPLGLVIIIVTELAMFLLATLTMAIALRIKQLSPPHMAREELIVFFFSPLFLFSFPLLALSFEPLLKFPCPSFPFFDADYSRGSQSKYCSAGCPDTWIGDKYCDRACNNQDCGFDAGDCGFEEVFQKIPGWNLTLSQNMVFFP